MALYSDQRKVRDISAEHCSDVKGGGVTHIKFESLDIALRLFGESTRLPRATREEIGITNDEVEFYFDLNDRTRQYARDVGGVHEVLVDFIEVDAVELVAREGEIDERSHHPNSRREQAVLRIRIPVSLARKLYALLHATVVFHKWPELWYTTGTHAWEMSNVFFDIFGKEEPTFADLGEGRTTCE